MEQHTFSEEEWTDIEPIEQPPSSPMVNITYSPTYALAMSYWRVALKSSECSQRVLSLTKHLILLNPAHYSVWHHRQTILAKLNAEKWMIIKELEFMNALAVDHPKSYQLWRHRQFCIEHSATAVDLVPNELSFLNKMLELDAKNYHAWAYRQWLIQFTQCWSQELDDVNSLLTLDVRNNSAWNHRYFYFTQSQIEYDWQLELLDFVWKCIKKAPNNESPWNYLNAWMCLPTAPVNAKQQVFELCKQMQTESQLMSPHLISMLIDFYSQDPNTQHLAREMCIQMANSLDTIRKKYWLHRQSTIQE